MADALDVEIQRVNAHTRAMLAEYVAWGDSIVVGEVTQWMYNELIDFVNFRMETAETCLQLISVDKIGDALGLCRSLLENYLLFMLMCRGRKLFRLRDRSDLTEGDFKKFVRDEQEKLKEQQVAGTATCLAVEKYPRAKRRVMYVFEGLKDKDDPDFVVPAHYFYFREFHPEAMRLKQGDYFEYYPLPSDTQQAIREHGRNTALLYQRYLSYDALLTCLELNDLVDQAAIARVEAHYTFLGRFLHPTHNAVRDLHHNNNYHASKPAIGMHSTYSRPARLLASLYVCYLVAGLLNEIAELHETAPKQFIQEAGTESLRQLTAAVPVRMAYFWFLFNDPPLYDKFQHCSHHVTEEELKEFGHYSKVSNEQIAFDQHILKHLEQSLTGRSNHKCGIYNSPIG
ncbi:hypothetical protein [Kibdelosporangium aridum]|uniref:Uncharacterized protein n=1 Tax=Kibdelosporangium aridum TaxID=2030 RepID=A0A1Y5Y8P0_KIBAR|nr:hypothetical protein [Kibdelosporangium aridum]SMD27183.1 hypothetical protein SAMN05661093_10780 [Kibdelosporangium aridum]